MKLVVVDWLDSSGDHNWVSMAQAEHDAVVCDCRSVGWVLSENKSQVTLTTNLHLSRKSPHDPVDCCGVITIPRCAIKKMRTINQ